MARPVSRWIVLVVLCVSLLLVALDATVLHVAVPAVTEDLRPGGSELLWIVDAYPLVCASLLILFGTLGDRVGRRRVLLLGYALFGAASALAAFAPDPADTDRGPRAARRRRRDDHARHAVDPAPGLPRPARAGAGDRHLERGRRGRRRGRPATRRLPGRALLVGLGLPGQHPADGRDAAGRPAAAARVPRRPRRPLGRAGRADGRGRRARRASSASSGWAAARACWTPRPAVPLLAGAALLVLFVTPPAPPPASADRRPDVRQARPSPPRSAASCWPCWRWSAWN